MSKVLIIDSDAAAAQELKGALLAQGIESEITIDGNDGLNLAKTYGPNCIVLCVELQRVSGYSICNKLKKDPNLSTIPLVLVSSQATEETFEQHKKLKTRAEGYLRKPYEMSALMDLLRHFVPMREPTQSKAKAPAVSASEARNEEFSLEDLGIADHASRAPTAPASQSRAPRRPTAESLGLKVPADEGTADAATMGQGPSLDSLEELGHDDETVNRHAPRAPSGPKAPPVEESFQLADLDAPVVAPRAATRRPAAPPLEELEIPAEVPAAAPARAASRAPVPTFEDDEPAPVSARAPSRPAAQPAFEDEDLAPVRASARPAARSAAPALADEEPAPASRAPTRAVLTPDPQIETLRTENRQLRQKVQQLEQTIQEKELEFNDRLLQESSRSRESVDLKKKITLLEREVQKHQQVAEQAQADLAGQQDRLSQADEQMRNAEFDRQALSDKMAQLVEKVKSLAAERQALTDELNTANETNAALQADQENALKTRTKAKKAVDIALQLLEETGLSRPM